MSEATILLDVRCQCRGRPRIPLRLSPDGLVALRVALNSHKSDLPPDTLFQTYYCADCQSVAEVTFRDLMLAA